MAKKSTSKPTIPAGLKAAFTANPALKAAYVSGDQWFFNEKTAVKHFGQNYTTIKNQ